MAVIQLYTFLSSVSGRSYAVALDEATQTLFATVTPAGGVEQQVPVGDLAPRAVDQVLRSYCEATTQVQILVSDKYPFAKFKRTINSRSCGYVSGDCQWNQFQANKTHESVAGARDGVIEIAAVLASGVTLEYSLDGVHFYTNNIFRELIPGTYTVYARSSEDPTCKQSGKAIINPGVAVETIAYPYQEKICKSFQLIRDGIITIIDEPIKWDQVNIKGNRDKENHGWKSQYSDGEIELEFDCGNGLEIIEAEYAVHGGDGETLFQYGYTYGERAFVILFDGKLNYNTRKKPGSIGSTVAITVEGADFNDLFASRLDTLVSLIDKLTPDEGILTPPAVRRVTLHSKELTRLYKVDNADLSIVSDQSQTTGKTYITPDTVNTIAAEIEENFGYALAAITEAPFDISLYNLLIKFRGTYQFDVRFSIDVKFYQSFLSNNFTIQGFFMVNDQKFVGGPIVAGDTDNAWRTFPYAFSYQGTHDLKPADEVYWFLEVTFPVGNGLRRIALDQRDVHITINALEAASSSKANAWQVFDAVDCIVRSITNNRTSLKSSFLAERGYNVAIDGPGALNVLTNGKQLRQFDKVIDWGVWPVLHPLKMSFNTVWKGLRAQYCLGYGFEWSGNSEFLRIERVNRFYRPQKIIQIDETEKGTYFEEVAKELQYNELEFGFDKFKAEGANTLDEFNTRKEMLTPIKTNKVKLIVKSPLILSGYSIEDSRRQQYSDTPSDSVENDEEPFMIATQKDARDKLSAERDEPFEVVNNVISPGTAYNLRHTPSRMASNWAIWVKNGFFFKLPTDKLKTRGVVQNGALETQFKATEPRPVGDIDKQLIREDGEIDLENYPVEERLFAPEWITFSAKVTPDKIILLNKAMRGGAAATENYGYVIVKDNDGAFQAGFPYELDYNFSTEIARFKLLKYWASPVDPEEPCCNYVTINGCKILINGHKIIV